MAKWGKLSFLLAALSMITMLVVRYIVGGWINALFIPFGLFWLGLILGLVTSWRTILEFLTTRTTKHGMNMGSLILLTVALLFMLNYLGVRFDKTFDFTQEKLNSLSEQSQQVMKGLDDTLTIYIFYKGETAKTQQTLIKQNLTLFAEASPLVKLRSVDTYVDNELAMKFLNDLNDKNQGDVFVFAEYKGKKVRVDLAGPGQLTEEAMTAALIRATRKESKKIYFVTGHGERQSKDQNTDSISQLVEALERASFQVATINFIENPKVPEDADVVAIIGPSHPFMEGELEILRNYSRAGGRLLIAADPGQKSNIALLTKSLGVEFKNNFILNQIGEQIARSMAVVIGFEYDPVSPITNKFHKGEQSIFNVASEVVPAPDATNYSYTPLVATHEIAFSVSELTRQVASPNASDVRSHIVALLAEAPSDSQNTDSSLPQKKGAATIVVGDSDFLANGVMAHPINRDFALNAFSYLAEETDLLSIRPKVPRTTPVMMTVYTQLGLIGGGLGLPLALMILAATLWFRRRGA